MVFWDIQYGKFSASLHLFCFLVKIIHVSAIVVKYGVALYTVL